MSSLASSFDRSALPLAVTFYRDNVEKFRTIGRHRASGLCPFHPDRHPSLSIDLDHGLYFCFSCGAGGDIPHFLMKRDGLSFAQAAKSLGAWRGTDTPEASQERRRAQSERERLRYLKANQEKRERETRLLSRSLIHLLEKDQAQLSAQLKVDPDNEELWDELILTHGLIAQELLAYSILSFGSEQLRAAFFSRRAEVIREVREREYFYDDDGRRIEVLQ